MSTARAAAVEICDIANEVLAAFSPSRIERRAGGYCVCWKSNGVAFAKRWQCRGQDFYPIWHGKWPGGGTASTALAQLIRWLRGQPVLPISTWLYWSSEKVGLLPRDAVEVLRAGGYPEHTPCVLCGNAIEGGLDWWSLDGVTGPCCSWTSGCRQKPTQNKTPAEAPDE